MTSEIATFAGGCSWCLAAAYRQLGSVCSATSGHMRGKKPSLAYENEQRARTGDAEVVQIAFDPNDISYADLLGIFFALHDPTTLGGIGNDVDARHGSAIFFGSHEQERVARETVAKLQPSFRDPIVTQVVASGPFREARDFDPPYCERHDRVRCGAPGHRVAAAISDLFARQAAEMIERRRAEEEARRTAVCLERGERMAHAGSWSVDVRTGALVWSAEHYRIFGLEPGAPITREQAVAMIHRDDRDAACETWQRAIAAARPYELQMRVVRPDGTVRRVRSIGHPVVNDAGVVEEFIGTLIDETERRDTEEALARTRGELAHVARVMTSAPACMDIEVLIPTGQGVRESIHIPLPDGGLAGSGAVGAVAGEIARQIFAKLPRRPDVPAAAPSLSPQRLRRVLAHIEEHLGEPVTVRQLATVAYMSAFHFARMFKRSVGMPPHAYMTQRRIERAKELLARSDLALVEVAARTGFQTQAHFTVVFHRQVGLPPRAFRLRAQASVDAR